MTPSFSFVVFLTVFFTLIATSSCGKKGGGAASRGQAAAAGHEEKHRKANFPTWVKIAKKICDDADFEADILDKMDECYAMSPLAFIDEPFRICRPIVFNPSTGFGPPFGAGSDRQLNHYRKTLCGNSKVKGMWVACIKKSSENFGSAFKPGLESESSLFGLYEDKMNCYLDLLDLA